jgi:hypothetical protein
MATAQSKVAKLNGTDSNSTPTNLIFPSDLLNPGQDGASMTFFINTIKNSKSQVTFQTGTASAKNTIKSPYGEMPVISQVSTGLQKDNGNNTKVFSNTFVRSNQSITLPIPHNLDFTLQSNWSKTDFGQLGMAIDQATDMKDLSLSGGVELVKQMAISTVGSIASKLAGGAIKGKELASLATATVANDYAETLFKNVDNRTFHFSWTLTPRNQGEADALDNMLRLFRFHMLPEFRKDVGNGNAYLLYPSSFDIVFWQDGAPNRYIPRISTCALTNVRTNYTPNGSYIKTTGGSPNSYTLDLQFNELTVLHKDLVGTDASGTNSTF